MNFQIGPELRRVAYHASFVLFSHVHHFSTLWRIKQAQMSDNAIKNKCHLFRSFADSIHLSKSFWSTMNFLPSLMKGRSPRHRSVRILQCVVPRYSAACLIVSRRFISHHRCYAASCSSPSSQSSSRRSNHSSRNFSSLSTNARK